MKKKIYALALSSTIAASQMSFAMGQSGDSPNPGSWNESDVVQWVDSLPAQQSDQEIAAIETLQTSVADLLGYSFLGDSSEGQQIVALLGELSEAIRARNGQEVFNKGKEFISLIVQITSNDDLDIKQGFDNIGRLVKGISAKNGREIAAAITDIALFIARLANELQS